MPELPDITSYLVALWPRIVGQPLERILVKSPFLVRTVEPDLFSLTGEAVQDLSRIGKRIVWHFAGERFLVFHLMIAGRFHWRKAGARPATKNDLAAFGFPGGTLMLTEASPKKRASLHVVQGAAALAQFDRGGLEPLEATLAQFRAALTRENHTLKRALADPRLFSGIGNAYSDEILLAAGLSPVALTSRLSSDEINGAVRCRAGNTPALDQAIECRSRGGVSREGDRVSPRDDRARPVRQALPEVRHAHPAHPLRRKRNQLLPALPDRRQAPRRPLPLATAEG